MKPSRREVFGLAGGAAFGLVFTPVPWRLVHDSALWSQSWPGVPVPLRGAMSAKYTNCTLCPAACGVKATCVNGQPVQLGGVAKHPQSNGMLCTMGLAGHHLPFHPERLRAAFRRVNGRTPATVEEAMNAWKQAVANVKPGEHVAILDQRPGRAQSFQYRRVLAETPQGVYVTMPDQSASLSAMRQCSTPAVGPLGIDLENTNTLISFGGPVLDGWGTPGRVLALRRAGKLRVIQVEPVRSRTADLADRWVPVQPGSEAAFAMSLAAVLAGRKMPAVAGISQEMLESIAAELTGRGAAVAIGGGDPGGGPLGTQAELAIAALNVALENWNSEGGIVERRETPVPAEWSKAALAPEMDLTKVPDGSIRALITDAVPSGTAIPRRLIERKLANNATVIRFSAFVPAYGFDGEYVIPTAAYPNALDEIPTPFDSPRATFALAAPLQVEAAADPLELLGAGKTEEALKARAAAIFEAGRGDLFQYASGETVPLKSLKDAGDMWTKLVEGATWRDSEYKAPKAAKVQMPEVDTSNRLQLSKEYPLALVPSGWRAAVGSGKISPLLSKVYQESGLREAPSMAAMNPQTGQQHGLTDGCQASVQTACGSTETRVKFDASVMPGVVQVAIGPERSGMLETCTLGEDCTWRLSAARMVKS